MAKATNISVNREIPLVQSALIVMYV